MDAAELFEAFLALLFSAMVLSIMRRAYRHQGFVFTPDCPEHVKVRTVKTVWPNLDDDEKIVVPLCDQPFVKLVDSTVKGWELPFVGFVSDERVAELVAQARRALAAKRF